MDKAPFFLKNLNYDVLKVDEEGRYFLLSFSLESPELFSAVKPGQFFMLSPAEKLGGFSPVEINLPRPFTIFDLEGKFLKFLIKARGRFTSAAFAKIFPGISILGPLGKGWDFNPFEKSLLVGAGSGLASLLMLAKAMYVKPYMIMAVTSAGEAKIADFFSGLLSGREIAIWDEGLTLLDMMSSKKPEFYDEFSEIFVCVPSFLVPRIIEILQDKGFPLDKVQFSLEAMMGCGFGGCGSCFITVEREGLRERVKVCKEGPVFKGNELVSFEP